MQQTSIKKNFIMNIILTMSSFIFPLISFPYISRVLGPEGVGITSFATSLITYFNFVAQLGIPTYGIRVCATVRDDKGKLSKTVHELLFINAIACVVSYIALFIAIWSVPKLQGEKLLYVIVSLSIAFNLIGMEWLYKGLEQYSYITIRSIIFKFIALIAMFLLIHSESDYVLYGGISIFAASASNVCNLIHSRKYISFKKIKDLDIRKHIKPAFVFFAMTCAATIYTNLDTVMLGFYKTDADVGYYNAAVKIKIILVSVVTSLGTVLLPRASYYIENNQIEEFKRIGKKAIQFVVWFATPMLVYFSIFAKEGILFLSGDKYGPSVIPMQIIMPTLLFIGLTNVLGIQMLVPLGKEKDVLYSTVAGAIVDLVINFALIPKYSSSGAAIGTLVAEMVVFVVQLWALRHDIMHVFMEISYWKIVIAIMGASMAAIWVKFFSLNCFLALVISSICFFAVYGLVLIVTRESFTKDIIRQVFQKVKNKG